MQNALIEIIEKFYSDLRTHEAVVMAVSMELQKGDLKQQRLGLTVEETIQSLRQSAESACAY